jgi:DNA-binding Lrp family transcriptional regulator
MKQSGQLDRYDHEILRILSQDGRLPVTELAVQV